MEPGSLSSSEDPRFPDSQDFTGPARFLGRPWEPGYRGGPENRGGLRRCPNLPGPQEFLGSNGFPRNLASLEVLGTREAAILTWQVLKSWGLVNLRSWELGRVPGSMVLFFCCFCFFCFLHCVFCFSASSPLLFLLFLLFTLTFCFPAPRPSQVLRTSQVLPLT